MQTETPEIGQIKTQLTALEKKATGAVIETAEQYADAIDFLSKIKAIAKFIKQEKEKITDPANATIKAARNFFAPFEQKYIEGESILKSKILEYKREVDRKARIEEERIAARAEKGTIKPETAERKMDAVVRVENTTRGRVGEVQIRKIKKVRITDELLVPREYLRVDEAAVRRDALGGKTIPGVEVYEEDSVSAR